MWSTAAALSWAEPNVEPSEKKQRRRAAKLIEQALAADVADPRLNGRAPLLAYFYVIDQWCKLAGQRLRAASTTVLTSTKARDGEGTVRSVPRAAAKISSWRSVRLQLILPRNTTRTTLGKNPNGYRHIPRAEMALFPAAHRPGDYQPAAKSIRDSDLRAVPVTQWSWHGGALLSEF